MKNIYYIKLLLGVFIALLISCEEGLEPQVFDKLSPSNYPKNEEDAKTAVTGVYHKAIGDLSNHYWKGALVMNTATTDEFFARYRNSVWFLYSYLTYNSGNLHVTKMYSEFVKGITNCVNTIELIDKIDMDQDLKTRYQAELRGIIAISAYYLYDFYGPTAIVTDPEITLNPNTEFQPERPTKEWMVNFIKETARNAANDLPVSYSEVDYGRITKGANLMVILKLAIHEKNWSEAATVSKEIMDLGYYQLQGTYWDVFSVENEMNNELIFVIPLHTAYGSWNGWMGTSVPGEYRTESGEDLGMGGYYRVPWDMYDKFEESNDDRLRNLWRHMNTEDGIVDLRTSTNARLNIGAVPYKYPRDPNGISRVNGNDFVVFRYADVLLLRAEALNNLNGPNQESIDLINMIRTRAQTSLIELSQFSDQQSLDDYILDERFRELFMEGHRRPDLIRHGKYLSEAVKRGAVALDEHVLLFPIPQLVIDENPKIQQNPGY